MAECSDSSNRDKYDAYEDATDKNSYYECCS
jgi:hypothetical protein